MSGNSKLHYKEALAKDIESWPESPGQLQPILVTASEQIGNQNNPFCWLLLDAESVVYYLKICFTVFLAFYQ